MGCLVLSDCQFGARVAPKYRVVLEIQYCCPDYDIDDHY